MTNVDDIDAVLPQTQCGLCGFKSCRPYAEALATQSASINLCPPGGIKGLETLGRLLDVDPEPFKKEMAEKAKVKMQAVIREAECIGCTKCIQACPVDAIIGASKEMHSIIADECTGCELCITPCPVDCIDLVPVNDEDEAVQKLKANQARMRFNAREKRIKNETFVKPQEDKSRYIQQALLRVKGKRK